MSAARILIVHDDHLLVRLYREKLEEQHFIVDVARDLEQAQRKLADRRPEAVLIDLVFENGNVFDFMRATRACPETARLPILILPTVLARMGDACILAGASGVVASGADPIASIVEAVKRNLGLAAPAVPSGPTGFFERQRAGNRQGSRNGATEAGESHAIRLDDFWVREIVADSVETVRKMRDCLPGVSAVPPELQTVHSLWTHVHTFAAKAALLSSRPLAQFAGAFDLLLNDLNESPEQLNASIIRTVGQAIDSLGAITQASGLGRLADPSAANLLVVDDEDGARRLIGNALELAGLKSDCAGSPSRALEKLEDRKADLIFLDVGLPEMNGFELCAKIRTVEAHKKTPIVFITGMATFQNKAKATLSGGNDFVGKPFNLFELGLKALIWLFRRQLQMV